MEIISYGGKKFKDKSGERVWFPKDGAYFDTAFRKTFKTAEEKAHFMNSRNIVNTGDSFEKYKKENKEAYEKKMDEKSRMV